MLHKIALFLGIFCLSSLLWAQDVEINPDHPEAYTVQEGDTLWDISAQFLVEPWRWPEIWQVNPQIENPHLIFPGDIISLSYDGDTPVLTVDRGTSSRNRNVRLSPQVRVDDSERAVHTIPVDAIRQFLTRPLVVSDNEMDDWPYIVSNYEQHLVASPGVDIYVRGLTTPTDTNKYLIYRKGPEYVSHSRGYREVLGYEAIYVGSAEVIEYGDPSTVIITSAEKEVKNGDRLVEEPDNEFYSRFMPSSPDSPITGSIISAENVLSEIGQYQVVVLDRGTADGIEVGNVFGVFESGKVVYDKIKSSGNAYEESDLIEYLGRSGFRGEAVTLPDVQVGVVMVFRTFDNVSYALVMEALRSIHLNDAIKSL